MRSERALRALCRRELSGLDLDPPLDAEKLCRRYDDLEPLWQTVTDAVPGVVLPGRDGTELKASSMVCYGRRVVEIRDALTQLSPLLPDGFDECSPERQAKLIRSAAKRYLDDGQALGPVRDLFSAHASSLVGDAEPLRAVSLALTGTARWVKS